jgi:hypothetical protein
VKRRRVPARLVFRFPVAEQLCADHDKHDHTVPAVSRCPADDRVVVQSVWIRTPPRRRGRQGSIAHAQLTLGPGMIMLGTAWGDDDLCVPKISSVLIC